MLIFSVFVLFVAFVAFPDSSDSILSHASKNQINIEKSGSLGLYHGGKCHMTYGNETLTSDEFSDWCSNIALEKNDPKQSPWIQYSLKGKQMKVNKFSVRNGCCRYYVWCCTEEDNKVVDYDCCCRLYSYSLLASNDNATWTVLYKAEKDKTFYLCQTKTFEIPNPKAYTYYRFVLDEEWPGCSKCMQINQIELYGETFASNFVSYESQDDDESISIIV